MGKQKFNHDADNIEDATGINIDALQEKLTSVVKSDVSRSQNIEAIAENFTKVELALMFDQSLTMVHQLKEILTHRSQSPLAGLLASLGKDEG